MQIKRRPVIIKWNIINNMALNCQKIDNLIANKLMIKILVEN